MYDLIIKCKVNTRKAVKSNQNKISIDRVDNLNNNLSRFDSDREKLIYILKHGYVGKYNDKLMEILFRSSKRGTEFSEHFTYIMRSFGDNPVPTATLKFIKMITEAKVIIPDMKYVRVSQLKHIYITEKYFRNCIENFNKVFVHEILKVSKFTNITGSNIKYYINNSDIFSPNRHQIVKWLVSIWSVEVCWSRNSGLRSLSGYHRIYDMLPQVLAKLSKIPGLIKEFYNMYIEHDDNVRTEDCTNPFEFYLRPPPVLPTLRRALTSSNMILYNIGIKYGRCYMSKK